MRRKFQITKTVFLVLLILIFLAIPFMTVSTWQGTCLFGASCSLWEYAGLIMPFILLNFIPFLVVAFLVWIVLSVFQALSRDSRKSKWIQMALFVLVLLTIPVLLTFMLNLFKDKLRVENKTSQILYLTVVTTNWYDDSPRVVSQNIAFRKHDIPVGPQSSVTLQYETDDAPLAGFAVCKTEADCRFLDISYLHDYEVNSYESLEHLNPSWLIAIRSSPLHNYSNLIIMALSLVPIFLLSGWLYLNPR